MRTRKALVNMLYSLFSYALLLIFGIIIRRFLLQQFNTEIVGYEGIIADMFSYVALADFGLDALFNYRLYEAFAKDDKERVNKLSNMYRTLWNSLGLIVMIICIILFFSLNSIFKGKVNNWDVFKINFILYSLSSLSTYFLGYWRSILTACQKEYKAIRIETILNFIGFGTKLIVLIFTKNFVLYLLVNTAFILLNKLIVYLISKKEFSYFKKEKTTLSEFKKEGMLKECSQLIMIKTADVVNWSSTNLFISLLLNVNSATLYFNYAIIGSAIWSAIANFIRPIKSTLADLIYKESKEDSYNFYKVMDVGCFFLGVIILIGYATVFQSAIIFFFGEEYLLPLSFVYAYAFLYYFAAKSEATNLFRECFGDYKMESIFSFIAIVTAFILLIVLSKQLGVAGIIISTILSYLIIWHARKVIVISKFYNLSLLKSWLNELLYVILAAVELFICIKITDFIPLNFIGMMLRGIISVIVPTIINLIIFRKSQFMDTLKTYALNFISNRRS